MKIVVLGPNRRAGALSGNRVTDVNYGMTRYLRERDDSKHEDQAPARLPARY